MILVVGATGQLGGLIARALLQDDMPVRVLVRSGSTYDTLAAGAEIVTGDLKNPSSLAAATRGIDAVVTTANSSRAAAATPSDRWTSTATGTSSTPQPPPASATSCSSPLSAPAPTTRCRCCAPKAWRSSDSMPVA